MTATDATNGFVGYLGRSESDSPPADGVVCIEAGPDWKLRFKSAGIPCYTWRDGFVLLSGNGFLNSRGSRKKLTAESIALEYLELGERVVTSLEGAYSVALWDAKRQKLLLWRDDAGAGLLYFYQTTDNSIWFASTLQLLLRYTGTHPISKLGLAEYLRFLDISPPYTIYENVVFLPSDQFVKVNPAMPVECQEKLPEPDSFNGNFSKFDDVVIAFDELLKNNIANTVESVPKVCSFLSGGIDSSLVTAVAATLSEDVHAVTVGFENTRFDESPVARRITEYLGIKHEVMQFTLEEDLDAFESFTSSIGSPFADPAIIPTYQCFERTSNMCNLVLDGTGADTLIGMMPARHIRFILNYSSRLPVSVRRLVSSTLDAIPPTRRYTDLFNFEDPVELLIRWNGFSKMEISELLGQSGDLSHTMFYRIYKEGIKRKNPYELYSTLMGNLPDDRIHQSRAIFGPEVAFPFFDTKIQSFVRSLPMEYRYVPGQQKKLFRHVLSRYIPERIWDVPKHGFDYPFENLMGFRDSHLVNKYLSPEALSQHGLFDSKVVDRYITNLLAGEKSLRFKIWALLIFQAWYENFYCLQGDGLKL